MVVLLKMTDNRCNREAKLPPTPKYGHPAYLVWSSIALASVTACKPCRQPGMFQFLFEGFAQYSSQMWQFCEIPGWSCMIFDQDTGRAITKPLAHSSWSSYWLTVAEFEVCTQSSASLCICRIYSLFNFSFFSQMVACLCLPVFGIYLEFTATDCNTTPEHDRCLIIG